MRSRPFNMSCPSRSSRKAHYHPGLHSLWLVSLWFASVTTAWGQVPWRELIDHELLEDTFGASSLPNGNGIRISQVEAANSATGAYFPVPDDFPLSLGEFGDQFTDEFDPVGEFAVFTDGSGGQSLGLSSHSEGTVGANFYGNTFSLASAANDITIYSTDDYFEKVLNTYQNQQINDGLPVPQDFIVQNHSYIAQPESLQCPECTTDADAQRLLRRIDYTIEQYGITVAVGLNNNGAQADDPNPTVPHPSLFGPSYNAIVIGRTDAKHSRGITPSFYGPNRYKPDIVVPRVTTSSGTATVSSAATMLHEVVAGTNGANSETMKAILLAGATKDEFASFVEPTTSVPNPWARSATQPLDDVFGAGELNLYNSFLIANNGQFEGSPTTPTLVAPHGWDYQSVSPGPSNVLEYDFVVPAGTTLDALSVILSWNVDVDTSFNANSVTLANLDLELVDVTGTPIEQSMSTIDNVEHIYVGSGQSVQQLAAGTYTLKVSNLSGTSHDFGLAWRTELSSLLASPTADFDQDGDVDGSDLLQLQRGWGTQNGATLAMGDAFGDGDVGPNDRMLFNAQYGSVAALSTFAVAVPEPTTCLLAGMGLLAAYWMRRLW